MRSTTAQSPVPRAFGREAETGRPCRNRRASGARRAVERPHRALDSSQGVRAHDRETGFLLPPSVDEWLPETHLARFVVEVIERLDLWATVGSLSWFRLGVLSSGAVVGHSGVRLRDGMRKNSRRHLPGYRDDLRSNSAQYGLPAAIRNLSP